MTAFRQGELRPKHVFRFVDEATVRQWVQQLSLFRFVAHSMRADTPDYFSAAFRYGTEDDLQLLLDVIGHPPLERWSEELLERDREQQLRAGKPVIYRRNRLVGLEHLAEPSLSPFPLPDSQSLAGQLQLVFSTRRPELELMVTGNAGKPGISKQDFAVAKQLDAMFLPHRTRAVEPPNSTILCMTPERWPELWSGAPIDWSKAM